MIQNDATMTFQMRYGGCFQVLSSDGTFLTAKKGLLPPKYDFAIDLTRNCIAILLRAKNAYLARLYRNYLPELKPTRLKVANAFSLDILQIWFRYIAYRRRNYAYNFFCTGVTTSVNK